MPTIKFPHVPNPKINDSYGYTSRKGRPMLFQILSPGTLEPLFEVFLALHTNPNSLDERMTKSISTKMSYGAFIEFVWVDELDTISCTASTGAFLNIYGGLATASFSTPNGVDPSRRNTMAWERMEDLIELFRGNGCIFNDRGQPVLRGRVMCLYDRGSFIGHFTSFSVKETATTPYAFELTWEFEVENTIYTIPTNQIGILETGTTVLQVPSRPSPVQQVAVEPEPEPVQQQAILENIGEYNPDDDINGDVEDGGGVENGRVRVPPPIPDFVRSGGDDGLTG